MLPYIVSNFCVAALSYSHISYPWILVIGIRISTSLITSPPLESMESNEVTSQSSQGQSFALVLFVFHEIPTSPFPCLCSSIAAACLTLWWHQWTRWQFSVTSSRWQVKMLNRTCPSTDPCSSLLDTSLQAEHDPLPTTSFYLSSCLPIQAVMYQLKYKKQGKRFTRLKLKWHSILSLYTLNIFCAWG